MLLTLPHLGLGQRMYKWLEALYSKPAAQVQVNGTLSWPFTLYNGTRQGCLFSPLLFVLLLEPLLATIRGKSRDTGHRICWARTWVICVCIWYLALYSISNPRQTLPNILMVLKRYGDISTFQGQCRNIYSIYWTPLFPKGSSGLLDPCTHFNGNRRVWNI